MEAPHFYFGVSWYVLLDSHWYMLVWLKWLLCKYNPNHVAHAQAANHYTNRSPTAGGQYHWVSEFAPPRTQKILSYLSGTQSDTSYAQRLPL